MKNTKLSLIFNSLIVIFVVFATICMYLGVEFMGHTKMLTADSINMLQYYTVQSNLLMGLVAAVYMVYDVLVLTDKVKVIPKWLSLLKLTFTVGVSVTLFTVVFYLAPITGKNFITLFVNSNLFYHLLVPVLAIITFIVFEKCNDIKLSLTPICLIPTVLYGIYYTINAFSHRVNGKIDYAYEWYGFVQGGVFSTIIVLVAMLGFTYLITWALWRLNRKKAT